MSKEGRMRHRELPADEHLEFDRLCQGLEDFEPLPARLRDQRKDRDSDTVDPDSGSLDPLILAGLVNPV
jgi:hypothetical protein